MTDDDAEELLGLCHEFSRLYSTGAAMSILSTHLATIEAARRSLIAQTPEEEEIIRAAAAAISTGQHLLSSLELLERMKKMLEKGEALDDETLANVAQLTRVSSNQIMMSPDSIN